MRCMITSIRTCLLFAILVFAFSRPAMAQDESPHNRYGILDSVRFVIGADFVRVWSGNVRGDDGAQYHLGFALEKTISSPFAFVGSVYAGLFVHEDDKWPFIYGFDASIRHYWSVAGFDGWYAGLCYVRPSEDMIEWYYRYTSESVLDRMSVTGGVFTSLSSSTELSIGFQYSLTARWISDFNYEGSYHAWSLSLRAGFAL